MRGAAGTSSERASVTSRLAVSTASPSAAESYRPPGTGGKRLIRHRSHGLCYLNLSPGGVCGSGWLQRRKTHGSVGHTIFAVPADRAVLDGAGAWSGVDCVDTPSHAALFKRRARVEQHDGLTPGRDVKQRDPRIGQHLARRAARVPRGEPMEWRTAWPRHARVAATVTFGEINDRSRVWRPPS
jgi:hypothetical protein